MDRDEIFGQVAMYGGNVTACTASASFFLSESALMIYISIAGLTITLLGFAYTVWNGNRNYQLQARQLERREKERTHGHIEQADAA